MLLLVLAQLDDELFRPDTVHGSRKKLKALVNNRTIHTEVDDDAVQSIVVIATLLSPSIEGNCLIKQ